MTLQTGINNLWSTLISYHSIDSRFYIDLLNDAMQVDLDDKQLAEDIGFDTPSVRKFEEDIITPLFEQYLNNYGASLNDYEHYQFQKWIGRGEQGQYSMRPHNHRGSIVSAVFYPLADPIDPGPIVFIDPRMNANRGYYGKHFQSHFADLVHRPLAGDLLIFPSHVWHYVYPTSTARIVIPFDLFVGKSNDRV